MRVPRASGNLANRAGPPIVLKVLRSHRRNRRDRRERGVARHEPALPHCPDVGKFRDMQNRDDAGRASSSHSTICSRSFARKDDDDSPRCGRASKRSPDADETKINECAFGMRACARVGPRLLRRRVPAGSMRRRTRAPVARSSAGPAAAHDESITDQGCRHTRMHHCNRLARENGRDRAGPRRKSAETSYRMTRQCCVFSPPASPTAKAWS